MDRKKTISDVAQLAGVSTATVSRVLNGSINVKYETELRVKEAIAKLNYEPNVFARNLRKDETGEILVIIPMVTNPFQSGVISGISDVLQDKKYHALISQTKRLDAIENEFIDMLAHKKADGAIIMTRMKNHERLLEVAHSTPIIQCTEYYPDLPIPYVSIDNYQASLTAMEHLLGLGHRRIALIGSDNTEMSAFERARGYLDALKKAGISVRRDYVQYADKDYGFDSAVAAANVLLQLPEPPTAILCITDIVALGAVRAAQMRSIQIPSELSIVGFDNIEFASYVHPLLTTVNQPRYDIGVFAAQKLLGRILSPTIPEETFHHFFEHSLIVRESTGPAKQI